MKKLILPLLTTLMITSTAHASSTSNAGLHICEAVKADNTKLLRKITRKGSLRIKNIFDDLRCNNLDILSFAIKHKSDSTGEYIINKLPKSKVVKLLPSLEAKGYEVLLALAKKRVE